MAGIVKFMLAEVSVTDVITLIGTKGRLAAATRERRKGMIGSNNN